MQNKNKTEIDGTARPVTRLYKTKEVAALWNLSYWTVRDMVIAGRIRPIVGVGKGWRWTGHELDAAKLERL